MKIVRICGGIGNQMFQYAFAMALEHSTKEAVSLDVSLYEKKQNPSAGIDFIHNGFELVRVFCVEPVFASPADIRCLAALPYSMWGRVRRKFFTPKYHFIDRHFCYQPELLSSGERYYDGYWQTERYFSDIADSVRATFSFRLPLSERNINLISLMGDDAVSVHVRRRDYCKTGNASLCSEHYYSSALDLIFSRTKVSSVLVFSDDMEWVQENLRSIFDRGVPVFFVDWNSGSDSWQDMKLMSKCRNNIIANSTFSWWGAWLNCASDKCVIAPSVWSFPPSDPYYCYDFSDVVPSGWISLPS